MSELDGTTAGSAVAELEPQERSAVGTKTILVLDGAETFLRFEQTILQRADWRVLAATTGGEALDVLEAERVSLLVMDAVLPDLRGDHVVRAIRSNPQCRGIGILIVTHASQEEDAADCLREGANALLLKPVSRAALCRACEELLGVTARRQVRTLVRLDVEGHGSRRVLFGHTVNLSAGGMLVESSSELLVGDRIDIRFHLPGDPVPVLVLARVVREAHLDGQRLWGLSFELLDEGDRKRVEAFATCGELTSIG